MSSLASAGTARHIHLDPLGGVAGDMFIAALLDAFPDLTEPMIAAIERASGIGCRIEDWHDATLTGGRFVVGDGVDGVRARPLPPDERQSGWGHDHEGRHHHGPHGDEPHAHRAWSDIRHLLEHAALAEAARAQALAIFGHLATAEARVHGVAVDDVTFHEVGNADSIADIIGAAFLIASLSPATWSVGALPLGGGTVRTAHGVLPVPAPATTLLLEGFAVCDDGIAGERVTPTGAAILRQLGCFDRSGVSGRISATGVGFGSRVLPGRPNILRAIVLNREPDATTAEGHRELSVIAFEIDDQTPEDIATALDRLRRSAGVHDVLQLAAVGKKGRMTTHIQILTRPDALEETVAACFHETTTIGLRTHRVEGRALPRRAHEVTLNDRRVRVKSVERPGGRTAKAESDDLVEADGQAARAMLRLAAEQRIDGDDD